MVESLTHVMKMNLGKGWKSTSKQRKWGVMLAGTRQSPSSAGNGKEIGLWGRHPDGKWGGCGRLEHAALPESSKPPPWEEWWETTSVLNIHF